ncbi:MAG TPA: ParB/RepB/Spo0J family partition protein [Solirubrobacteraceae bacterium]
MAETTTSTKDVPETITLPNAVNGMELRMIPIENIIVPEDRHERRSRNEADQLGDSMDEVGLETPILVSPAPDGKFLLTAGGGRLENAKKKGWREIHALVKYRDAKAQAASTAIENIVRENLSPAEEADAIELMIKAGYSPREAASKLGFTQRTGTLRMPLVEMPDEVRGAFHHGGLPPSLVGLVKTLYDGNHQIGVEIGRLVANTEDDSVAVALSRGAGEFLRLMPTLHRNAKLKGRPPFVQTFRRGSDHGRSMSWSPKDRDRIRLKGKAGKWFTALSNKVTWDHLRPKIALSEEDLDTAVAVGFAYHSEGEHGSVWVHDEKWLTDYINEFVLPRMQRESEEKAKESPLKKLKKAVKAKVSLAKMKPAELAPTLERRFKRNLQAKAHAANMDLGRAITTKLAVKKLTREHALLFAYEAIGSENGNRHSKSRRIAECAARVMEDWVTVETRKLKNGETRTKVTYLEGEAAEKRLWEYIKAARTPEEILQRVLHIFAAAATFKRECGPNGKEPHPKTPENSHAAAALAKLVKAVIPASVKRITEEAKDYNPTEDAEKVIAQAKKEEADEKPLGEELTKAKASRSTRRKGSATRAAEALAIVTEQPGITIPELAKKMDVNQSVLYKLMPDLAKACKVTKRGRGWHPSEAEQQPVAQAA